MEWGAHEIMAVDVNWEFGECEKWELNTLRAAVEQGA